MAAIAGTAALGCFVWRHLSLANELATGAALQCPETLVYCWLATVLQSPINKYSDILRSP